MQDQEKVSAPSEHSEHVAELPWIDLRGERQNLSDSKKSKAMEKGQAGLLKEGSVSRNEGEELTPRLRKRKQKPTFLNNEVEHEVPMYEEGEGEGARASSEEEIPTNRERNSFSELDSGEKKSQWKVYLKEALKNTNTLGAVVTTGLANYFFSAENIILTVVLTFLSMSVIFADQVLNVNSCQVRLIKAVEALEENSGSKRTGFIKNLLLFNSYSPSYLALAFGFACLTVYFTTALLEFEEVSLGFLLAATVIPPIIHLANNWMVRIATKIEEYRCDERNIPYNAETKYKKEAGFLRDRNKKLQEDFKSEKALLKKEKSELKQQVNSLAVQTADLRAEKEIFPFFYKLLQRFFELNQQILQIEKRQEMSPILRERIPQLRKSYSDLGIRFSASCPREVEEKKEWLEEISAELNSLEKNLAEIYIAPATEISAPKDGQADTPQVAGQSIIEGSINRSPTLGQGLFDPSQENAKERKGKEKDTTSPAKQAKEAKSEALSKNTQ